MEDIIAKQLAKKTTSKINTISYYESVPLAQIQIDTFFYHNELLYYPHPFLMIVDIATKYINIVPQKRKNENIEKHLDSFCQQVQEKYKTAVKRSKDITIISDGAKEFNVLKKKYNHKVSVSIHKAAVAESYIALTKRLVRKIYTKYYVKNIFQGKVDTIKPEQLVEIMEQIQVQINQKAKIKKRKALEQQPSKFEVGDAVFIKSNVKFYEQLRGFKKKSYIENFVEEPFYISDIIYFNGIYKYEATSFFDHSVDIHYHYEEELQLIDPTIVEEYIKKYNITFKSKHREKTTGFIPKD